MELTNEFFQKFVGWQAQILYALESAFFQGEIKSIELRSGDGVSDELHIQFNWCAWRQDDDPWVKAEEPRGKGRVVPIEYYYVELHEPRPHDYGPDCFTIGIPGCEQIVTFYAKGQMNWINPQTLSWLEKVSE